MLIGFDTRRIAEAPDAIAPDGSEVRLLGVLPRGSMAAFRLAPGPCRRPWPTAPSRRSGTSSPGRGMWRRLGEAEEVTEVGRGVSVTIPTSAHFQFRCDGGEPLEAVAVTMPPGPAPRKPIPSRENGSRRFARRAVYPV
jgi:hypothetical protein